jgi:hypothetical protein
MCRKWDACRVGTLDVQCVMGLKLSGANGQLNVKFRQKSLWRKNQGSGQMISFLLVNAAGDTIRKATVSEIGDALSWNLDCIRYCF